MWTRHKVRFDCCCRCEQSRNYSTIVKGLVVLKVTRVACEVSLNRRHLSKNIYVTNRCPCQSRKLVSGLKLQRGTLIKAFTVQEHDCSPRCSYKISTACQLEHFSSLLLYIGIELHCYLATKPEVDDYIHRYIECVTSCKKKNCFGSCCEGLNKFSLFEMVMSSY